jgi:hypothetical protein
MAETISVWEYIGAQFIGFGVFALGVVIVALVFNFVKKKHETR